MDYFNKVLHKLKPDTPKNFYLDIQTNGFLPYNTSTVALRAFENKQKTREIKTPDFKWYKNIENRNYKLDHTKNTYNFSYKDVGHKIIAICTDPENPHQMEATEFGPILLDPQTKIDLEGMIISEKGVFEVELPYRDLKFRVEEERREADFGKLRIDDLVLDPFNLVFRLGEESFSVGIKVLEVGEFFGAANVLKIVFRERMPFLERLVYTEDENGDFFVFVRFFTRIFKENFCVLLKLFLSVRIMPFLKELEQFESIQKDQNLFKNNLKTSTGDILLIFSNFKNVLKSNINYTKKVIEERDSILKYSESLENDLKMTLHEYKETFYKTKFENRKMDFSKIEKMENTLININSKKKENSFINENLEGIKMNENRYNKMKDDYEKMKKLNKLLVKELKKIKSKKRDKYKKINQSLSNLKELSLMANKIKSQSFFENSNNFSELDQKPENLPKKTLEEIKEENDDISFLQKKNEILKNQIISLKTEKITKAQIQPETNPQNPDYKREAFFLRNCIKDLRSLIQQIIEGKKKEDLKKSYLNDSIIESVYNAGIGNKIELLNIENSLLLRRVKFLSDELKMKRESRNSLEEISSRNSEDGFRELNLKIGELKNENVKLMKEIDRLENIERETEDIYKKQNVVLKGEIEHMKKNRDFGNGERNFEIEELKNEIEEKDQMIDQMGKTNSKLIEEIQKLQELVYNNQSMSNSDLKSFN